MYWQCCSNCVNIFGLPNSAAGVSYCPKCNYKFPEQRTYASNVTLSYIENNINIHTTSSLTQGKSFYHNSQLNPKFEVPAEDKLIINAESITISNDKISITIDNDNVSKFNVIEINGHTFVRCD